MATVRRVQDGIDRALLAKFRLATHSLSRQRELRVGQTVGRI
jgi:hypothetical protein